jgi:magnesium transporter
MSKKHKKKAGLPPGTVVFTGEKKTENIDITLVRFNDSIVLEKYFKNQFPTTFEKPTAENVCWYDVKGLDNISIVEAFGRHFNIHRLVLEDIVNIGQRPKFDEYEQGVFISMNAFLYKKIEMSFQSEQISFYLGKDFLLSFQEDSEDLFQDIRKQIEVGKEKIRHKKSDYLAYVLVDSIVDSYSEILDTIEEQIEILEIEVINNPTPRVKSSLYHLKRELNNFKKNVISLREAVLRWSRSDYDFIEKGTNVFLRDLLDHINQTIERSENCREMLSELQGLYLSGISARTNGVINVLTIISSIFIPLTFIAGVYGMNFRTMPELEHPNGYPIVMAFMGTIALGMLGFFKYRKWI